MARGCGACSGPVPLGPGPGGNRPCAGLPGPEPGPFMNGGRVPSLALEAIDRIEGGPRMEEDEPVAESDGGRPNPGGPDMAPGEAVCCLFG
jgi:hypothetical protein